MNQQLVALLNTPEAKALAPEVRAAVERALSNRVTDAISWPKLYKGRHLEPGLVRYNMRDPKTGEVRDITFLLPKPTIDRMRPSFQGKPVVNEVHKSVNPQWFKDGHADGIVVGGEFDGGTGWECANFYVWDEPTNANCQDGYELSCAYVPTEIDWTAGLHHNIPYDGVILNGEYTHLAVVPDPRYRGAIIEALNSGGDMIMKLLFGKDGDKKAVELDKGTAVTLDGGKQVPLAELVNAHLAAEAEKSKVTATAEAAAALQNDATELEVDGKKITVGALKAAFKAVEAKNAADEDERKKKEREAEEAKNAMCDHGEKKDDCAKCKEARNADEKAKADKEKEEKEKLEAKNAADAAEKAKGTSAFDALKNAAAARGGAIRMPEQRNDSQKEAEGSRKYGGTASAAGK